MLRKSGQFGVFLFLFFISCKEKLMAQLVISEVEISQLKNTKNDYLEGFVDTKISDTLNLNLLNKDLQRLKNLNAIVDGNCIIDTIDNQVRIRFQLKEALTKFPIINFGGVKGNLWYQLGFNDDNWLGRGQKLTTFYQNNDGRHNFNIYYKIPQFQRSKWGASISLFKWASIEPLYFGSETVFYDYDNISLGLSSIYTYKRKNTFELGLTYFVENYSKNDRHDDEITSGPGSLRQPKLLGKLIYQYNNLKYNYFYLSGIDNVMSLQTVYNSYDGSRFNIFLNDTRYFLRLQNNVNLAFRFRLGLATNVASPFAPFVLDSYVNIRGSGNRIERGTAALVLNAEYRQTVFESSKFGAQLVAFSDMGSWRDPGGDLDDLVQRSGFQFFVGGGIRLIYKNAYNFIFRLDYGVDTMDPNRRGLVLGLGQYF